VSPEREAFAGRVRVNHLPSVSSFCVLHVIVVVGSRTWSLRSRVLVICMQMNRCASFNIYHLVVTDLKFHTYTSL
jgi:hypothetical protein